MYQIDGLKEVDREGMKVEQSYIDETNRNTVSSGLLLVVDEEATAAFHVYKEGYEKTLRNNRKIAQAGLTESAIASISTRAEVDDTPKYKWGIENLTAYANENEIDLGEAVKLKDIWTKVKETL